MYPDKQSFRKTHRLTSEGTKSKLSLNSHCSCPYYPSLGVFGSVFGLLPQGVGGGGTSMSVCGGDVLQVHQEPCPYHR